jgi:CRP-like cAMP-binding protein
MRSGVHNALLARLPREVVKRIEPDLKAVFLPAGVIVHKPGEPIRQLYFPTTCMISVTVTMWDGRTVEAAAIGSREGASIDGFVGGRETTHTKYIVRLPGHAMTIATRKLRTEFDRNAETRDVMLRVTQAFVAQISQNVACACLHEIDQRLARWLLEVRSRARSNEILLTHGSIAEMLGVRRAGVSMAAVKLKDKGFIEYTRGYIKICDLAALQNLSCECYSTLNREYDRLLGSLRDLELFQRFHPGGQSG